MGGTPAALGPLPPVRAENRLVLPEKYPAECDLEPPVACGRGCLSPPCPAHGWCPGVSPGSHPERAVRHVLVTLDLVFSTLVGKLVLGINFRCPSDFLGVCVFSARRVVALL